MILYTRNNKKVRCVKTEHPKFRFLYWDSIIRNIDNISTEFYFTTNNNRGYFYFMFADEWFKCNMEQIEFDLYDYLVELCEQLYVNKTKECE